MLLRPIDNFLNNLTMYRLLGYGLTLLAAISLLYSALGTLQLPFAGMLLSLAMLLVSCFLVNMVMSRIWQVPSNSESWAITAFILFFILPQATDPTKTALIFLAGAIAMASKYIIAWQGKHLFNPAAFAAVCLGLPGLLYPSWWIGSSLLWPFALVFGLLVVRKIRRFPLSLSFVIVSSITIAITAIVQQADLNETMQLALTASPLIFLGTIMLTEPVTMPPLRRQQVIFGTLVGLLYALPIKFGDISLYPEMALVLGNIYAFAVSPKYRLRLRLQEVQTISDQVRHFVFTPDRKLDFHPGQYLEWTLGHAHSDSRGNRRTFTIASSPTEPTIQLGVKLYQPSSSFKKALLALKPGDRLYAGELAGNFILPKDPTKPLVFIAGGIGITPFRSMLKYLVDSSQKRDITLLYLVSKPEEVAYKDVLGQAETLGVRVVILANGEQLDAQRIQDAVPDFAGRMFYLSGPNKMVESYVATLRTMKVPRTHIETDHFSGY